MKNISKAGFTYRAICLCRWVFLLVITPVGTASALCEYYYSEDDSEIKIAVNEAMDSYSNQSLTLGFNVELAQIRSSVGDYNNKILNDLVSKLEPRGLRYPGGTPANYFDWKAETLNEKQVRQQANKHINKLLDKLKDANKGKLPVVGLRSFSQLTAAHDIKPFFVLNVFQSNKEIVYAINKVRSAIKGRVFWELGNEVSNELYKKKIILPEGSEWSTEAYVNRIKFIGQYIKSKYPDDKIGVVVSEMAAVRNPNSVSTWRTEMKRKSWDAQLNQAAAYFDAVIVHPYVFANKKIIDKIDIEVSCKGKEAHSNKIKYWAWVMSNISNLSQLYIQRLNKRFPQKSVWLTEFGVIDQNLPSQHLNLQKQTGFRALSSAANYLSWLKFYPQVNVLLNHGMFVGYGWAHIVYPDLSYSANGIAYSFVKEFLHGLDEIANVPFTQNTYVAGIDSFEDYHIDPVFMLSGINQKTAEKRLLLVNVSNHAISLTLPWQAKSMLSKSFSWDEVVEPATYKSIKDYDHVQLQATEVKLPPRSISILASNNKYIVH